MMSENNLLEINNITNNDILQEILDNEQIHQELSENIFYTHLLKELSPQLESIYNIDNIPEFDDLYDDLANWSNFQTLSNSRKFYDENNRISDEFDQFIFDKNEMYFTMIWLLCMERKSIRNTFTTLQTLIKQKDNEVFKRLDLISNYDESLYLKMILAYNNLLKISDIMDDYAEDNKDIFFIESLKAFKILSKINYNDFYKDKKLDMDIIKSKKDNFLKLIDII